MIVNNLTGNLNQITLPVDIRMCETCTMKDHRRGSEDAAKLTHVNTLDYFRSSVNMEADKEASRLMTHRVHNKFSNVLTGIWCFQCTFKLRVKGSSCPYQVPSSRITCALQQPLKEELDRLLKQKIHVPLDVHETVGCGATVSS